MKRAAGDVHSAATKHLSSADARLAAIIARVGPCKIGHGARREEGPFVSLVAAIVGQQLSGKAADTIFGRVCALGKDGRCPDPASILALPDEQLRGAGLSRAKVASVRDLAARVHRGELRLDDLDGHTDENVIEALTAVRGIGRWTAEMFLMFRLVRPDVLPVGDLGIRKGFQVLFRMRELPTPEKMERLSRPWRPHRTVACWYLWRLLDEKTAAAT